MRALFPTPKNESTPEKIAEGATAAYLDLRKQFDAHKRPVDFDFRDHCVGWTTRGDHYTHRLHRYPGRLTPYIPLFFLGVRGLAVDGGRLLDPFAGCGTVLVEAPVHPSHPMTPLGLEINPLARLITKVKTTPLEPRALRAAWHRIRARYDGDRSRVGLHAFPNKRHWFTRPVEEKLARVLRALAAMRDQDLHDFFMVAVSSVIRNVSTADPSVSVPVKLNPDRFTDATVRKRVQDSLRARQNPDVIALLERTVLANLARLEAWTNADRSNVNAPTVLGADARTFATAPYIGLGQMGKPTDVKVNNIDLVLTSPPYANAQRYTRSLRLELFVLGYTSNSVDERKLDEQQVGTERVPEIDWSNMVKQTDSPTANQVLDKVSKLDEYRAAIVGRYVRDMRTVLQNCYDALKPGGHAVFVIGNNCVRGHELDNTRIFGELGDKIGFKQLLHVRNRIPSRGLLTKRHPTAGVISHEHVLVFQKSANKDKNLPSISARTQDIRRRNVSN